MRSALLIAGGLCLVLLAVLARLAALESGGPTHWDWTIGDGTPATLYLPYGDGGQRPFGVDPPEGERPMPVVLLHGFASDRRNMSPLARSLARAGYAVLAVDVAGHGENRRAGGITGGRAAKSPFYQELEAAVLYLRTSELVDGERMVMMGHSMGASSSLGYGSWDPSIDGVVMIAGGWRYQGPHRPPNALFIYAEGDPQRLHTGVQELAAKLAGQPLDDGEVHGDFDLGTAVSHQMVRGTGHVDIVDSDVAMRTIIDWLDRIAGESRSSPAGFDDPRLVWAAFGGLLLVVALPGLGLALARLAPAPSAPGSAGAIEVAIFLASLVLSLPLIAAATPLPALSIEVADLVAPYLFAAGTGTLCTLAWLGRFDSLVVLAHGGRSLAAAMLGVLVLVWLLAPIGLVFHGLTLTPERSLVFLALAVLLAPVGLVLEGVLRRGGFWKGVGLSLLGRVAIVAALAIATAAGVLPGVVFLMLPILGGVLIALELPAAAIRAGGGSPLLGALFQMGMLAWIFAAVLPVRI